MIVYCSHFDRVSRFNLEFLYDPGIHIEPILILTSLILIGCDNNMPTSSEQPNKEVHTEVGILNKLISIPAEPITVKWEINESKKTRTGSLRALLKFKDEDKLHILKNSTSFDRLKNDTLDFESYEQWLPEDAKVGIKTKKWKRIYTH